MTESGRHKTGTYLIVFSIYAILTVIFTYPLVFKMTNHVKGPGDPLQLVWTLAWHAHKLTTNPFVNYFDANIFYPHRYTLALSDCMFTNGLIALPTWAVSRNPVLAYNLVILLSFPLSAFAVYLLLYDLTGDRYASFLGGFVFGFVPYRYDLLFGVQRINVQWIPLALWSLRRLALRNSFRYCLAFAAFCLLQALGSFYIGLNLVLATGVYIVALLTFKRRSIETSFWLKVALSVILVAALTAPFVIPYLRNKQDLGLGRSIQENVYYSSDLFNYIVPSTRSWVYGRLATFFESRVHWTPVSVRYFPGLTAIGLLFYGLRRATGPDTNQGRQDERVQPVKPGTHPLRFEVGFYAVLALVGFTLSLGPYLVILGRNTHFPLPHKYLYAAAPILAGLRMPAAIGIVAMLAVSVLSGLGAARLMLTLRRRMPERQTLRLLVGCALIGMLAIEYATFPITLHKLPVGDAIPGAYQWLADQQGDFAVMELPQHPLDDSVPLPGIKRAAIPLTKGLHYMYYSTYHWKSIVNGYSSFVPPSHFRIFEASLHFPDARFTDLLKGLGVRYVLVHAAYYEDSARAEMLKRIENSRQSLRMIRTFGDDYLLELI